jgi:hypothetical protein
MLKSYSSTFDIKNDPYLFLDGVGVCTKGDELHILIDHANLYFDVVNFYAVFTFSDSQNSMICFV